MKTHTTNYYSTFIQVAEDCPAIKGTTPKDSAPKSAARVQYEMLLSQPYQHTGDDVLYVSTGQPKGVSREEFFLKGQPCLRASALPKRYGWGVHYDAQGKTALVGMETEQYRRFSSDTSLTQLRAMRNKKADKA